MKQARGNKQLRSFGLIVGAAFAVIGLWPVLARSEGPRPWALVLGASFVLAALVRPGTLGPVFRLWMAMGNALGRAYTTVVLGAVFYGLITPIGMIRRRFGDDPMPRTFDRHTDTYRVPRGPRPTRHLTRQF